MKTRMLAGFVLALALTRAQAALVAQWSFNSPIPDSDTGTGSTVPAVGTGIASLVGTTTSSFVAGDPKSDPAGATDNSGWNTTTYPAATNGNQSAGVRFDVSTVGYEKISVSWAQRHSSTASRYTRVQYTLDGYTFIDADLIVIYADSVFTNKTVSFSAVPGADNNPLFGFRIVSEFESSATGSGTNAYVATKPGSTYSSSGTIRFDMLTVSGTLLPGANTPPGLSSLSNRTLRVGQTLGPVPFTVWDQEDAPGALLLSKASSDPAVVADWDIVLGGSGQNRTLTLTAGQQPGTSVVTIYVTDSGGKSSHTSFTVTVLPANTPPVITGPARTNTVAGAPVVLPFTVGDLESPAAALTVSGSSANPLLLPDDGAHLLFGGSGSNRTVTLTPAPGRAGAVPITLSVSDGVNTATATFPLLVTPSAAVLLYDPFDYADGSLLTNSGFLWANRSGTDGQCQVANGQVQLTSAQTEDVVAPLVGGPYARSNATVLYASFRLNCLTLPRSLPEYFAHFVSGSSLRGRIFVGTTNAGPGCYRLFVANGSETNTMLGVNLCTNTDYRVVCRYVIDTATTTLWLNPLAEADPGVVAADALSAVSISSYAFRQDSGLGATLLVDELRVGLSFAAVVPSPGADRPRLVIEPNGPNVLLRWTNPAFGLQSAPAPTGPFTNCTGTASPALLPATDTAKFFRLNGL